MNQTAEGFAKPRFLRHHFTPRTDNGEWQLALAIVSLGLGFNYESRWYLLDEGRGFMPDFNLRGTRRRRAINVELTWADWAVDIFEPPERAIRALELKRWKIRRTYELYGIRTVLVTYADWRLIVANPKHLSRMIREELSREQYEAAA